MIPMSCPKCGRRGSVPPDRLNTRMHCKKCDAVFHMDKTGHIVLGEPVDEDDLKRKKAKKPKRPRGQRDMVELGLGEMLKKMPLPVKIGLGVAGLVVLFMFGLIPTPASEPVPETLEDRAAYVANAFADDSPRRASYVAADGTSSDIYTWFEKARPQFKYEGPQTDLSNKVMSSIAYSKEQPGGDTLIVMKLIPPQAESPDPSRASKPTTTLGYDENGYFDLPLYWKREKSGGWMLDGKACLQSLSGATSSS